jgi:hypothetical protein
MEGITGQKFIPVHMRRVVTISHEHLEIHEGEDFFFDHLKSANSAETLEILVKTSGTRKMMHAYIECSSLLTATWALYEGTTKTYNASNALTIKKPIQGPSKYSCFGCPGMPYSGWVRRWNKDRRRILRWRQWTAISRRDK